MQEVKAADQKKEIEKGQQTARQEGILKTLKLFLKPDNKTLDTAALAAKLDIKESLIQSLF